MILHRCVSVHYVLVSVSVTVAVAVTVAVFRMEMDYAPMAELFVVIVSQRVEL